MKISEIEKILKDLKQPKYRLKQIKKAYYQDGALSFEDISNLPKSLRDELDRKSRFICLSPLKTLISQDKKCLKSLLRTNDNNKLETVLIGVMPGNWTACLSSQIGCPLKCKFCATGSLEFKRNLNAEEIIDQIAFWRGYLSKNKIKGALNHIVFMGMGEPFLNWENVKSAINDLIDPEKFGFGARSISISTVGIPEGIANFAKDFNQINLAVSLHSANQEKRNLLMPISRKYSLCQIKKSLENYIEKTGRKIFLEYLMMADINDSQKDADELVKFVKSIEKNYLLHVNLIPYNQTSSAYKASPIYAINNFKNYLLRNKVSATARKSLGQDIKGACGQLAAEYKVDYKNEKNN